jgi:hypothetical protein
VEEIDEQGRHFSEPVETPEVQAIRLPY